ncbi:proteasome assembly chaperone 3 isoform X1 [Pleurodeles waltl]|uniref:proteasome assembly chaperone 3 isoform X1 n=1 Tax=Pleurodeles waltl TaxID=8319 RepID=UPI0037095CCA
MILPGGDKQRGEPWQLKSRIRSLPQVAQGKLSGMAVNQIIKSKQAEEEIRGIRTEVVCTAFEDRILVVATQFGKMGTLVSVTPSVLSNDVGRPSLSTKVLLGKDEPLTHVCAKNLVTFVSQESGNKPVLLALALKEQSADVVMAVKAVIQRCRVW